MKTVKQLTILGIILIATTGFGQYLETFSIPDKGILPGTCAGTEVSCTKDFVGETWTINGDFLGMDSNDFFATDASGRLNADGDCDALIPPGLCFETPAIDISLVGTSSFTLDLDWVSWDVADICNVAYQLDDGAWLQLGPLSGTDGPGTVQFITDSNNGSGVASASGLVGNKLSIRVCLFETNSFFDDIFIDNVSVPEAGTTILPVKWADFTVRSLKEGNQLDWATYTEVNNERFEIEKSVDDMVNFNTIGIIRGAGNSLKTEYYKYLDKDISNAVSYYRIKQVDFDGNFEYSEVKMVQNNLNERIRFVPNPFSDHIIISANQQELIEGSTLRMYNNQGQLVLDKIITEENSIEPIETAHLNSGMYFMHFNNGEIVRLVKF